MRWPVSCLAWEDVQTTLVSEPWLLCILSHWCPWGLGSCLWMRSVIVMGRILGRPRYKTVCFIDQYSCVLLASPTLTLSLNFIPSLGLIEYQTSASFLTFTSLLTGHLLISFLKVLWGFGTQRPPQGRREVIPTELKCRYPVSPGSLLLYLWLSCLGSCSGRHPSEAKGHWLLPFLSVPLPGAWDARRETLLVFRHKQSVLWAPAGRVVEWRQHEPGNRGTTHSQLSAQGHSTQGTWLRRGTGCRWTCNSAQMKNVQKSPSWGKLQGLHL